MGYKQDISKAEAYLKKRDPQLGALIDSQELVLREAREDSFASLLRSIVGQQVSVKAAETIYGRLREVTGEEAVRIVKMTPEQVKKIGLSRQKTSYLKDLSEHFLSDSKMFERFWEKSDWEVIETLTEIKGIGKWTAQMFLLFTLERPDVFAPDDAGLKRAVMELYGESEVLKRGELEEIAKRWSPYRSVASLHLWQSLHNTPQ